jgi:mRNA-degrading endonuclease RelE of RelBE toxin-antitoxin system
MKTVVYTRKAARGLARTPSNVETLIRSKLDQLAADPNALANNVKALKGLDDAFRLRVGDWRVLFRNDRERIVVLDIGPRGTAWVDSRLEKAEGMTDVRTKTPTGEPILILPEAEFERLRELAEDAQDSALAARIAADLDAGREELLTTEEVNALLAVRTPLALWRRKRNVAPEQLIERTGADPASLAKVEQGECLGDVHPYQRLAEVLNVSVEDLISEARRR